MHHRRPHPQTRKAKWDELDEDCLVNVLGRVGVESLFLDIPFVCKSWHKATRSPLCWQRLDFPYEFSRSRLWRYLSDNLEHVQDPVKFFEQMDVHSRVLVRTLVMRSKRCATLLDVPRCCDFEELNLFSKECPALKTLILRTDVIVKGDYFVAALVSKLKDLEFLEVAYEFVPILREVITNCKNLVGLRLTNAYIAHWEASTIIQLPNLKFLVLRRQSIERESLVMILKGCKKLVRLDVSKCKGFEVDDEILELASHIATFEHEGARGFTVYNDEFGGDGIDSPSSSSSD